MGRPQRITEPGVAYHLLNRRVMRLPMFEKDGDYLAFEQVLAEGLGRLDAPGLLSYCLMPNHWHLVVLAGERTNLSTWMQWVTVTHTHRWRTHSRTTGEGPLYQGRFKSFPVEEDAHFLTVCRYVEANALRSGLVDRAEQWRWCSLWLRRTGEGPLRDRLAEWRMSTVHWPMNRSRRCGTLPCGVCPSARIGGRPGLRLSCGWI